MNPVNNLLQEAINAVRSGNKKEGAQKLAQVVQQDQRNAEAWYWLSQATDDPNEAAACLRRVLKIDPNYGRAKEALTALEKGGVTVQDVATPAPGYGTPYDPSATQSMRPLNTGELLGSTNSGFDTPYGSYTPPSGTRQDAPTRAMPNIPTPPPPPFGDSFTPAPAPAPFGNDPTPPPPFGMPAWANQAGAAPGGGTSQRPGDPYAGNAGGPPPPPPFATPGSGTGLRFSQLDPAAAQAAAEAQAIAAQPLDPNADLRARLLGNQSAPVNPPPPIQPTGQRTFTPDPNLRQQPVQKKKSRISPLLWVVLAIAVIAMAVAVGLNLTKSTTITPSDQANIDATATAGAALSGTPGALTPSPGATTTGTAAGTTSATTTVGVATTTAAIATTTAGVATTAAAPSPTVAKTLAGPTPTVAKTLATAATGATPTPTFPGGATTTAATTVATTTAPPPPTPVPPKPTTAPPAAPTAVPGAATPVATPNTQGAPQEVKDYVENANNLIGALGFVEDNVNRLVIQPYRDGKFKDKPLERNEEFNYYQLEMGQIARKLKDARVPEGAFELQVLATDYATHLGEMSNMIDLYISTGQTFYADRAAIYYDKAKSERLLWLKTVQQGYPYKVSLA